MTELRRNCDKLFVTNGFAKELHWKFIILNICFKDATYPEALDPFELEDNIDCPLMLLVSEKRSFLDSSNSPSERKNNLTHATP